MTTAKKPTPLEVSRSEARILHMRWKGAVKAGQGLPMYEDVMLGGLGRSADRVMLVGNPEESDAKVLQAGRGTVA